MMMNSISGDGDKKKRFQSDDGEIWEYKLTTKTRTRHVGSKNR